MKLFPPCWWRVRASRLWLRRRWCPAGLALALLPWFALAAPKRPAPPSAAPDEVSLRAFSYQVDCLVAGIENLLSGHGPAYPRGAEYLAAARRLRGAAGAGIGAGNAAAGEAAIVAPAHWRELEALRREALLAHPRLRQLATILVVKRRPQLPPQGARTPGAEIGLPTNHECNSSLPRTGYDNEIAAFAPTRPDAPLRTVYRPAHGGYVGEIDLHPAADRLLLTQSDARRWSVHELRLDGSAPRPVTRLPDDVDSYDACYLPNGRLVFGSSAPFQAVPCWHGLKVVTNLYTADLEGGQLRRLCYDQDHDLHPVVLPNGQVLFSRWDYTGLGHIFVRELMVMNPDGTGQRAVYGSNSYFPNALYFPRALPGRPGEFVCILSGYHGVNRMGQLVLVDTNRGAHEAEGIVRRISGRGDPVRPEVKDDLVSGDWPKFLHPYPLDDDHYLVAGWLHRQADWCIYLADRWDNLVLLRHEPGYALLEPVPVRAGPPPPVIPDRVDLRESESVVYLHDVYAGPGLAGVPRGTVKALRLVQYHFAYPGLAGPHLIGRGGPWEVMRILGTVPVDPDGSALFRIPANTPLALQPLDAEGKAVQLMRSWYTGMPGEKVSCLGCHEPPAQAPAAHRTSAQTRAPSVITPWRGPARGFDFEREVQPVLDRHCVACHQPAGGARPDLRPRAAFPDYRGLRPDSLGVSRMHPAMRQATDGYIPFTPAYEALIPYVRRVNIEDDVRLLVPGEYHADTSELIQLLRQGHGGVQLDAEAWDRLVTWIDLNAPCHGTWGEVFPIPDGQRERRRELNRLAGGPDVDPEAIPAESAVAASPAARTVAAPHAPASAAAPMRLAGWPWPEAEARARQAALGVTEREIDLGAGVRLRLVRVPAGRFVLGAATGAPDEQPATVVTIARPFWIAATETTHAQFQRFDPAFDSRDYQKRHARDDDRGLPLNTPAQPAVRVSWEQAMAFCAWLTARTGGTCTLPTEAQWEWACRAGSGEDFAFGSVAADFTPWANLADRSFSRGHRPDGQQITGGLEHLLLEGATLADRTRDDRAIVTAPVGSYRPNAWGLYDLHGNAAEWTRTAYRKYPYNEYDGRNDRVTAAGAAERRVVRGGSFFDRPARARASGRLAYPAWQRVFNVGFRVVVEDAPEPDRVAAR